MLHRVMKVIIHVDVFVNKKYGMLALLFYFTRISAE
ncbi:hypothetical protein DFQ03_2207 [Maribacter caenipelagi]|uniref:Uncharacterized protein n=1 Tax=Maribacter caenipelagi TaxID=1447781 RepID=A0A4R7D5H2_9FLAO|nr:hypothetical protein DFQ03_2207 [Maribacter caenipelagi]